MAKVTITEDSATTLLVATAEQAAKDLRGASDATETDKHTAWEFLRYLGLNRTQQLRLLSEAEAMQAHRRRRDNGN